MSHHKGHKNTRITIVASFCCLGDTSVILLQLLNATLNGSLFPACINVLKTSLHICLVRLLSCGRRRRSPPNLLTFRRKRWNSTSMATPGSKCSVCLGFPETEWLIMPVPFFPTFCEGKTNRLQKEINGKKKINCYCDQFWRLMTRRPLTMWQSIPSFTTVGFISYKGLSMINIIIDYFNCRRILERANHNPSVARWWIWKGLLNDHRDDLPILS